MQFHEKPEFLQFIWMLFVAFIGATVGFIGKVLPGASEKTIKLKMYLYIAGLLSSLFVAYITYELCGALVENNGVCVALAGLASYAGTDLLVAVQAKFIEVIKRKLDKL